MIYPFVRRKLLVAFLLCFLFMSAAAVNNQLFPAYAKKAKQEKASVLKSNDKETSQEELLELISSLKQTIEKLDSRISTIESRLDMIVDKTQEDKTPSLTDKWISFSTSSRQKKNVSDKRRENIVDVAHVQKKPVEDSKNTSEVTENLTKQPLQQEEDSKSYSPPIKEKTDRVFMTANIDNKEYSKSNNPVVKALEQPSSVAKAFTVKDKPLSNIPKAITATKQSKPIVKKFRYNITVQKEQENNYEVGSILIGGKKIIAYRSEAGGLDPYARAQIVAQRIEKFLSNGIDVRQVQPALKSGQYIGSINNNVLFTVDPETANRSGLPIQNLTLSWVNNLRTALGAPKISRANINPSRGLSPAGRSLPSNTQLSENSAIIEMLIPMKPSSIGSVLHGIASWYGPYFHGRRAADGSRYNMYAMTAAHKTLPFGTIVKVTNINNNKECIVRITDRGPYIHGRIIDLSKAAAQKIGMLGSGTAKVKVEIIGKTPRFRRRR